VRGKIKKNFLKKGVLKFKKKEKENE